MNQNKHGHQPDSPPQHLDQLLQENYLTESHGSSYLSLVTVGMSKMEWKFSVIAEQIKVEVGVIIDIGGHDLEMVLYQLNKYVSKLGRSKQLLS